MSRLHATCTSEDGCDGLLHVYAAGTPAVDLLLLMAASENDCPKTAELIRAGAKLDATVGGMPEFKAPF